MDENERIKVVDDEWMSERKKRHSALFVNHFLNSVVTFNNIYTEIKTYLDDNLLGIENSGLFKKIKKLDDDDLFPAKTIAHQLFRLNKNLSFLDENEYDFTSKIERIKTLISEYVNGDNLEFPKQATQLMFETAKAKTKKGLDSVIGTGYHPFKRLRETVYEFEKYLPQFSAESDEKKNLSSILDVAIENNIKLPEEFIYHYNRASDVSDHIAKYREEQSDFNVLDLAKESFDSATNFFWFYLIDASRNPHIVRQIITDLPRFESVYSDKSSENKLAAEKLFADAYKHSSFVGTTGIEKAFNLVDCLSGNFQFQYDSETNLLVRDNTKYLGIENVQNFLTYQKDLKNKMGLDN